MFIVRALNSDWLAAFAVCDILAFVVSTFLGNYIYSLVDAKEATDMQPLSVKPIIAGNSKGLEKNRVYDVVKAFEFNHILTQNRNRRSLIIYLNFFKLLETIQE